MRHLLALFVCTLTIPAALRAQIAHDLTVFSEEGLPFTLLVNGRTINVEPATSVTAENINFDYARVMVRFADESLEPIDRKNLQIAHPGQGPKGPVAAVYAIKEKKGERVLRFVSRSDKKLQAAPLIIINN